MPDADLQRILAELRRRREQLEQLVFRHDDAKAKEPEVTAGEEKPAPSVSGDDEIPGTPLP